MIRKALSIIAPIAATAGLFGCATTEELAAKDAAYCDTIGITAQMPERLQCVTMAGKIRQDETRARYMNAAMALGNAGRSMSYSAEPELEHSKINDGLEPMPSRMSPAIQPQKMGCVKTTEYASAFNKVCNYNCAGSPYSVTINAVALCPLTP